MARPLCVVAGLAWLVGCGGPDEHPCQEREDDAAELPRVMLTVREQEISAEVADDEQERSTAWAGRVCELDALLWVPEAVEPAAVTLCGVEIAVDLAFIRQAEVVAVEDERPPCEGPCQECPRYGEAGPAVDAVLWLPAGQVDVAEGDSVQGLQAVALPSPME